MLKLRHRILPGRRSREVELPPAEVAEQESQEPASESLGNDGPALVLLVPTVGGLLSFRIHTFASVEPAADFAQSLSALGLNDGIIAFWALQSQPDHDAETSKSVEVVVLIRDPMRADVAHLTSFVDMESAESFVRQETQGGLDPQQVLVYWAALVSVEVDGAGSVRLSPSAPPRTAVDLPAPAESPAAELRLEAEAAEPEVEEPEGSLAVHLEFPAPAESPVAELRLEPEVEEPEGSLAVHLDLPAPAESPAAELRLEAEVAEPEVEERSLAVHLDLPVPAESPVAELRLEAEVAEPEVEDRSLSVETGADELAAAGKDGGRQPGDREGLGAEDIVDEVRRVLRVKRWDTMSQPFAGFNSPPGRF